MNSPQSWSDLTILEPTDPRGLIKYSTLNGVVGIFSHTNSFLASSWGVSPVFHFGQVTCNANGIDNTQLVEDARAWTLSHLSANNPATLAKPLTELMFLRDGLQWTMFIPLNFGVTGIGNPMLSFRDNATSAGSFLDGQATHPVIYFPGLYTGINVLQVTLSGKGHYKLAIVGKEAGIQTMYEMEWHVVD